MKLGELDPDRLRRSIRGGTLRFRCGPFVHRLHSKVDRLADDIAFHYADYSLADPDGFADFHLRLMPARGIRRYLRPQIVFSYDGYQTFGPEPARNAFPIMEWGYNWCVGSYVHQYLVFHAAAVEREGRVLIIVGRSGAGKSTLCAGLTLRGWRLFSDELAMVRPADGHLIPVPRPLSLKNRSIDVLRQFEPKVQIGRACHGTLKGTLAHMRVPTESIRRDQETAPPAWVVFVKHEPDIPARLTRQPRGSAMIRLADNAINYSMLGSRGFDTATELIEHCQAYNLCYSSLEEAVDLLGQLPIPASPLTAGASDASS